MVAASAPHANQSGLVYEVECILDPEVVSEFDAWLPGHVRDVLRSPGFLRADTLRPAEPDADGKVRRINRYHVRDRAALDHYLEQLAPGLREDGARRFAGRASYARRVLAADGAYLPTSAAEEAACANCGTPLYGHYCAECGQLARESARSLGTLFHDAWHVLTHIDGRFWQTLRRLAFSPGFLTNEYFAERRARYIPPFRLYLVLSLIFFGLTSLTSAFEPSGDPIVLDGKSTPKTRAELEQDAAEIAKARAELTAKGAPGAVADVALERADREVKERLRALDAAERAAGGTPAPAVAAAPDAAPTTAAPAAAPAAAREDAPDDATAPHSAAVDGATPPKDGDMKWDARSFDAEKCSGLNVDPAWLKPALTRACLKASKDGGKSLLHAFVSNIPKMMLVFLPLMAALMLVMYWWPRRFYVEHLVFYLHVHAAMFLGLTVLVFFGAIGNYVPPIETLVALAGFAFFFYAVWYVWRAMRVHYRNGRLLTFAKLCVIFLLYVTCLSLTAVGTALVSALNA